MTVQCLYQNDPKDAAAVLGQRNACRRAANKLGWLIQQERICDASEGTPLLLRPDVQELLRDVEQGRFQVLVVASAEVLQCPEGEWESLLAVLQKGRVRTFAAQRGCWLEPGGQALRPRPGAAPRAALAKAGLDETAQIGLSCCGISVKRQKTSVSILICAGPWKR